MLESMTGAAGYQCKIQGYVFSFHLRSVNGKNLECHFHCAAALRSLEDRFYRILRSRLSRGRLDVQIRSSRSLRKVTLDEKLLFDYRNAHERLLGRSVVLEGGDALQFMQLPGVISLEEEFPLDFPVERLERAFEKAVSDLRKSRLREGLRIRKLFEGMLRDISQCVRLVRRRLGVFQAEQSALFHEQAGTLLPASQGPDRQSLELAFLEWFDRFSVREEVDRLDMHVAETRSLIKKREPMAGKQLEFFLQEMQREAVTIASKVRDYAIRRHVVDIRTNIENMKEQVRNIC